MKKCVKRKGFPSFFVGNFEFRASLVGRGLNRLVDSEVDHGRSDLRTVSTLPLGETLDHKQNWSHQSALTCRWGRCPALRGARLSHHTGDLFLPFL